MEEDYIPTLSADTQQILNEFLREKAAREYAEQQSIESNTGNKNVEFEENWNLSQFWYNMDTRSKLATAVQRIVAAETTISPNEFRIALLSCPSLYANIKDIHDNVKIFEYDQRFSVYAADFVHYDFNEATTEDYLQLHAASYDLIIADPPFLSEECITKISKIITKLQRNANTKVIFCSGQVVENWLTACLPVKKCQFCPEHTRNLGNEFVSYANFNLDNFVDNK